MFGTLIPLKYDKDKYFYYNKNKVEKELNKLKEYIDNNPIFKDKEYSLNEIFPLEITYNNLIENPNQIFMKFKLDDLKNKRNTSLEENNLLKAYRYILNNNNINKESLKELYSYISKDLLEEVSLNTMGEYYRKGNVLIRTKSYVDSLFNIANYEEAIEPSKVNNYMNNLLEFINDKQDINNYIKSQIIHFYFVFIHPYYDCNGRTSRTLSLWYLLNNKEYSYTLFNRAISFNRDEYLNTIRKAKHSHDLTSFLIFMNKSLLKELRKAEILRKISNNVELSYTEKEIIQYFLSIKGDKTINEFTEYIVGITNSLTYQSIYNIIINMVFKNIFVINNNVLKLSKSLINEKQKKL